MSASGEHFLARQAILDRSQVVMGYELLFRSGLRNYFTATDVDDASRSVIADSFLVFGIEELTEGTRAYINVTRSLLVEERPRLLPAERVVVELLESIKPDPDVVDACARLKRAGYTLALDDFEYRQEYEPLLRMADIVKIDFRLTKGAERSRLAKELGARGITLLAEKVETQKEFQEALFLGYHLFQGYYFSKPAILTGRSMAPHKAHYLRFLQAVNASTTTTEELARIIQADVGMSLKLLRYLNSAHFGLRQTVTSVQHALYLLGEREIRRWGTLLTMSELSSDKPDELLRTVLVRAKLAELISQRTSFRQRASEMFLLGLFSLLDAMLDQPLETAIAGLPLAKDLQAALLGRPVPVGSILNIVVALERGNWRELHGLAKSLHLKEAELAPLASEAMRYPAELWYVSGRRERGGRGRWTGTDG